MANPRKGFAAGQEKLAFRYVDLKRHFCKDETDTLSMTVYSRAGSGTEDFLIQEISCPGESMETRTLAKVPGGVDLKFSYLDKLGTPTSDVSKIKAVQLNLTLHTKKTAGRPGRARTQTLQVDCPNLL
jgi:hypothetical protein